MNLAIFFSLFLFAQTIYSSAQKVTVIPKHHIAIFAPLYLDSAFDAANNYRYANTVPGFISSGLEFYEGVQLALDSMNKENLPLEVFVFDTRSATKNISKELAEAEKDSVELIIAYSATNEIQSFAPLAQKMKIPFINANLPNDGGVYNNPYFVLMNPTLKTHIEAIYRYIQGYYPLDNVFVFRKKGQSGDLIKSYLDDIGKNTPAIPLKIKYTELPDSFSVNQITRVLDSNEHSLCIAGSLDENFGRRLALQLAVASKSYPLTLMGMPTFDNLASDFIKPEYKGLEIIYSNPFFNPRTDKFTQTITNYYSSKMYASPSDWVLMGYETTWRFSKLLLKYKNDIASNLTRKEFDTFRDIDIQPVLLPPTQVRRAIHWIILRTRNYSSSNGWMEKSLA